MPSKRTDALSSVDEYLTRVPPRFRVALQRLRRSIRAAAPDAEEIISYQMPAFRQDGMLVYFGAFSDHCSLFVGSATVRRQFSDELKPFESGKGTLRFTPDRPLPPDLIRRLVRARLAENAARRRPSSTPRRSKMSRPPAGKRGGPSSLTVARTN